MTELFEVVAEDADLLIINKPAGLVCHPTKGDEYSSLASRIRIYLGRPESIHLINRLDRETSGLIVVGKNDAAAAELRSKWEAGLVTKKYLAIVEGRMSEDSGWIDQPIGPAVGSAVVIRGAVRADGAPSQTHWQVVHRFQKAGREFGLVLVTPKTGRKHQIRIHLSALGHPIVGDKIYGPDEAFYLAFIEGRLTPEQIERLVLPNHALHAGWLEWPTGPNDSKRCYSVQPEGPFREFLAAGDPPFCVTDEAFVGIWRQKVVGE